MNTNVCIYDINHSILTALCFLISRLSRGSILLYLLFYEKKIYKMIPDRATEATMDNCISINYFPLFKLNQNTKGKSCL